MGHSVLLHDFSKFVDVGLGDAAVRGHFCVWDGVSEFGRWWEGPAVGDLVFHVGGKLWIPYG